MARRLIKSDLWREKWALKKNQLAETCINEEFLIVSSGFGFFKDIHILEFSTRICKWIKNFKDWIHITKTFKIEMG